MPKTQDKPPADQILDGEAVEKGATDNLNPAPKRSRGATVTTIVIGLVMLGCAAALYYAYDKYSDSDATTAVTDSLGDRVAKQAEQLLALENRLTSLDQAHQTLVAAVDANQQITSQQIAKSDQQLDQQPDEAALSAMAERLDRVTARLALIEQTAQPVLEQNPDIKTSQLSGNTAPSSLPMAMENNLLFAQTGVVVVSAIIADNSAGRPLTQWLPVLDSVAWDDETGGTLLALRPLFTATPRSRDLVLADARRFVAPMIHQMHDRDAGQGLIDQASAQLAKLIQLRPIDQSRDDAIGHLARFEAALAANDLDSAVDLAKTWPGPAIDGFDEWRLMAESRLMLDRGVADMLVTSLAWMNRLAMSDIDEAP